MLIPSKYTIVKEDRSDRFLSKNIFHGIIVNRKALLFSGEEYRGVNSTRYDTIILVNIQALLEEHLEGYI